MSYFQDEARFGQKGTLTRVWARTGSRPRAARQTQYDYLYLFAAVCPETGDAVGLLSPHVSVGVMNSFLEHFSNQLAADVHAVMILDQAGWHVSGALQVPANVTLILLPPRSPELNPVENLWHWITSHHWSNRVYGDYAAMEAAAIHAWQQTCLDANCVKSVCAAPYLRRAG